MRAPPTTSGLETEWDYSGTKGRDKQKKKIGKANERKGKVKRGKDGEVNGQGGRWVPRPQHRKVWVIGLQSSVLIFPLAQMDNCVNEWIEVKVIPRSSTNNVTYIDMGRGIFPNNGDITSKYVNFGAIWKDERHRNISQLMAETGLEPEASAARLSRQRLPDDVGCRLQDGSCRSVNRQGN